MTPDMAIENDVHMVEAFWFNIKETIFCLNIRVVQFKH